VPPVDWPALLAGAAPDAPLPPSAAALRSWLAGELEALLGGADEGLLEFILAQLAGVPLPPGGPGTAAPAAAEHRAALAAELREILDADADGLVARLWSRGAALQAEAGRAARPTTA
jgi:hypothetical protein